MEQQLTGNTVLRVAYVGSHGYHGMVSVDPNSIPAQVCQSAALRHRAATAHEGHRCPGSAIHPRAGGAAESQSGRGFLLVHGRQHQLQRAADRSRQRLSQGLQIRGNFTWSKNLDMNSALTIAQGSNAAADDHGSQQSAPRLGAFGAQRRGAIQHLGHL